MVWMCGVNWWGLGLRVLERLFEIGERFGVGLGFGLFVGFVTVWFGLFYLLFGGG